MREPAPDLLSDLLRVVRLGGAVFLRGRFSAPWGILSSSWQDIARYVAPGARHLTLFHMMAHGEAWVGTADGTWVHLEEGDFVLLPFGDRHTLASDPSVAADPFGLSNVLDGRAHPTVKPVVIEGGGAPSTMVCGYVRSDDLLFHPFLKVLPPVIVERARGPDSSALVAAMTRQIVAEADAARPGAEALLSRVMELLFIETVRREFARMPAEKQGWLRAFDDPVVGRALGFLHAAPERRWTVEELAREAGASRSVLADRFRDLIGEPPMHYLQGWRLQLAADRLDAGEAIAAVAAAVGYESEAAFNRAFRKALGTTPGAWRSRGAGGAQAG